MCKHAAAVAALMTLLVATGVAPGWAAHDAKRFELDSNAVDASAPGYDWNSLFPVDRSDGEITSVFVADGPNPPSDTSYFTGGGSKDINDVTAWRHTTGDVAPDKNELTNAFAVAYRSPVDTGRTNEGDLLIYFGADRYANNGDAQIGFWFFRNPVGARADGTFSGSHAVGDILVLSDFTQGGRVGTVRVYRWVGSGGSDGPLDEITSGKECGDGLKDDAVCSTVNDGAVPSPWTYEPKFGDAGEFPAGSFYEGGINATRLVGVRCFSSFMAETRSSQSVDAQLKDLALGDFDTCPPDVAAKPASPRLVSQTAPRGPQALAESGPADLPLLAAWGLAFVLGGWTIRRSVAGLDSRE